MNKGLRTGSRLVVAALATAIFFVGSAGLAGAQDATDPYVGPSPTVQSEVTTLPPAPPAEVQAATTEQAPVAEVQGTNLAFTGGDVTVLAGLGLAALVVGSLLLVSRRRTAAV